MYKKIPYLKFGKLFYLTENEYDLRKYLNFDTIRLWYLGLNSAFKLNSIYCCIRDALTNLNIRKNINLNDYLPVPKLDNYLENNKYVSYTQYLSIYESENEITQKRWLCNAH